MADRHIGEIALLRERFGFLSTDDRKVRLYFLRSELAGTHAYQVGDKVSYILGTNGKGPCARDIQISVGSSAPPVARSPRANTGRDYMAQAVIARDNRQFDQAERLFRKAFEVAPPQQATQIILSFAAMEKNRGRKKEAMDVYREGLKKVQARKIYEDAAALAISLELFSEARRLLTKALELSKPGTQGGLYLLLGRNAFKENTTATLKEAVIYYERAIQTLSPASFPKSDLLSLNVARLRDQHHRGNLAFNFFNGEGFKVIDVEPLDAVTQGADLVVGIVDKELTESFGVEATILVRVYFKAQVSLADIDELTEKVAESAAMRGTDEQLCLIVTASVSEELKKVLFARIENKNKLYPAVIPLSQEAIETGAPRVALNEVFGQWLYRRDLFNVNFPVVGRRFFGRNRDLDELKDAIADSIPVGLFGLRKVGKTSLLKELARRGADNGDIYVYIDLLRVPGDVRDFKWIYWRLSSELHRLTSLNASLKLWKWRLGGRFESFLDIPENFAVATAFDADLTGILKAIDHLPADSRPKLVFLLDEIERLLPNSQGKEGLSGYFDFFSYVRGVSQESNSFSLVVTGANAAISETAQFEGRDNPAFNFFKEIYLRLLPSPECNAMLTVLGRGMGIKFEKGAIPEIVKLTGGHPFFSRQFCSFLAEKYGERPLLITDKMVDDSVEQYILFCDKDMREIFERLSRDYPDEKDFCLKLACDGNGNRASTELVKSVSSGTALRHLVGYQLIEFMGAHVHFTMELLALWLKRKIGEFH
ncbi:MAG TPA: hypothetical protein VHC91_26795 [Trinickia sp.]|uniref:hypothetical protein n=1 Tax=Trinickia sp. TaxID=2571163 RepID=UPI002BB9AD8D|nr:hypothetical protein [Trinickia sp.]HVW53973.1 hypothetical protein [Trinickia sp.]